MKLRRLFYDDEGDRTPLVWALYVLGWSLALVLVFGLFCYSCAMMDAEAAKNPLYSVPAWVQDCAQHRPLADCERDWKTMEGRVQH